MQHQPPAPPPSPGGGGGGGIDTRTGAFLSYLLTWITGIIMLFVGKQNPTIKYHAAQSIVYFGSLTVVVIILDILANIRPLGFLSVIALLVNLIQFISWIYCLIKAWTGNGERFALPVVGGVVTTYAEQVANAV